MVALEHRLSIYQAQAEKKRFDKGMMEGLEQGLEQGRREGHLQVAKNMKESNIAIDIIAKCTELCRGNRKDIISHYIIDRRD